jgi:hypothetical protein
MFPVRKTKPATSQSLPLVGRNVRKGISDHVAYSRHLARAVISQHDPNARITTGRKEYDEINGVKNYSKTTRSPCCPE